LYYSPDEAAGLSVFFTVLYICSGKGATWQKISLEAGKAHLPITIWLAIIYEATCAANLELESLADHKICVFKNTLHGLQDLN